ncbi:MAG: PorT family protein, partial [Hymenobacter sp.]
VRYRDADAPDQRADYRSGLEAGVLASIGWKHVAVQPAVLYSQRGFVLRQAGTFSGSGDPYLHHTSVRLDYLMLPLNVAYTQHANGQGAQVFAGVYLGVLVGGRFRGTTTTYYGPNQAAYESSEQGNVRVGDPADVRAYNVYGRRFDSGVQLGLGYRCHGLLAQASYSLGLRNVDTFNSSAYYMRAFESYGGPSYRNQAFQVSLAYLVGTKS